MAFRELGEMIDVAKELAETTKSPTITNPTPTDECHANYHRRVVIGGVCFAVLGAALGIALAVAAAASTDVNGVKAAQALFVLPFFAGIAGFIFGMCAMCLFAPAEFLTGPVGERWMKKSGPPACPLHEPCASFLRSSSPLQ